MQSGLQRRSRLVGWLLAWYCLCCDGACGWGIGVRKGKTKPRPIDCSGPYLCLGKTRRGSSKQHQFSQRHPVGACWLTPVHPPLRSIAGRASSWTWSRPNQRGRRPMPNSHPKSAAHSPSGRPAVATAPLYGLQQRLRETRTSQKEMAARLPKRRSVTVRSPNAPTQTRPYNDAAPPPMEEESHPATRAGRCWVARAPCQDITASPQAARRRWLDSLAPPVMPPAASHSLAPRRPIIPRPSREHASKAKCPCMWEGGCVQGARRAEQRKTTRKRMRPSFWIAWSR